MTYTKDFSVIVPCWRGDIKYLPKLFLSIPEKDGIEIIVVDNSKEPVRREEIESHREITLLHSAPERHAGGSRNDGIDAAKGKWLLFADSDDYYTEDAFDVYYSMIDTDAEIVYTCMSGIYEDTGERSDRGDKYKKLVQDYCEGKIEEMDIRMLFFSPCCKMVSHNLVDREGLKYDEIRASNDVFFSVVCGYYARSIAAIDTVTYIATVNRGSLTKRRDYDVIKSRFYATLHCNQFKKQHGLGKYQQSVAYYLKECLRFGLPTTLEFLRLLFQYRQNPFIGWNRWLGSMKRYQEKERRDAKYIIH